tara:strand:- start:289 stop:615 length:327 start_codon:yes stop_codon:yes gene_type:complete
MTYEVIENTLKNLLLREVKITSRKRVLGTGTILLYDLKDFNIKIHFTNNKKVEILYPFSVTKEKNIILFDYRLEHIHQEDIVHKVRYKNMVKNPRNKYYDLLLSIEQL